MSQNELWEDYRYLSERLKELEAAVVEDLKTAQREIRVHKMLHGEEHGKFLKEFYNNTHSKTAEYITRWELEPKND